MIQKRGSCGSRRRGQGGGRSGRINSNIAKNRRRPFTTVDVNREMQTRRNSMISKVERKMRSKRRVEWDKTRKGKGGRGGGNEGVDERRRISLPLWNSPKSVSTAPGVKQMKMKKKRKRAKKVGLKKRIIEDIPLPPRLRASFLTREHIRNGHYPEVAPSLRGVHSRILAENLSIKKKLIIEKIRTRKLRREAEKSMEEHRARERDYRAHVARERDLRAGVERENSVLRREWEFERLQRVELLRGDEEEIEKKYRVARNQLVEIRGKFNAQTQELHATAQKLTDMLHHSGKVSRQARSKQTNTNVIVGQDSREIVGDELGKMTKEKEEYLKKIRELTLRVSYLERRERITRLRKEKEDITRKMENFHQRNSPGTSFPPTYDTTEMYVYEPPKAKSKDE